MSPRLLTTVNELTQRLTTLFNQPESALALSTTFPHSEIELECNNWVWVLRQGSMSLRPPTTVDELTQRLATLSNQLESALALSTTFPHSGIELEANDGYAWTTRICIDLHVVIKLSIYLSIRSDEGKDNDWICQAPHNRGVSPQYIDIFHLNLTA